MKVPNLLKISLAMAGAFLVSLSFSQAGEVVIDNFDDPIEATLWYWENWSIEAVIGHDDTLDAGGGGKPGSMRGKKKFPNKPGGYKQTVLSPRLRPRVGDPEPLSPPNLRVEAGSGAPSPRDSAPLRR